MTTPNTPTRERGFTLIEAMITVAIITIVTVIAVPNFQRQMRETQRTDAMAGLMSLAAEQEKFYLANATYGTTAELGTPTTEHGYYTLAVTAADAAGFTATATPPASSPQSNDKDCAVFRIDGTGNRTATNADGAANNDCWR